MPAIDARDVTFLELRDAVLCSECELISYNSTSQCLACGSRAVLSLSRVLGGSLRGEECARVLEHPPSHTVIEMRPAGQPHLVRQENRTPRPPVVMERGLVRAEAAGTAPAHSAMKLVVERAYRLSRSGGAAIAVNRKGRLVCEARMGVIAPSLGAEVRGGITAMCAQSARSVRCDVADDDPRVDALSCRRLGIKSMVAAPITSMDSVLGLLTVVSPQAYVFDDRSVAVVQWLAGMMAVVLTSPGAELAGVLQGERRSAQMGRA